MCGLSGACHDAPVRAKRHRSAPAPRRRAYLCGDSLGNTPMPKATSPKSVGPVSGRMPKQIPDKIRARVLALLDEGLGATEIVRNVAREFDGFGLSVMYVSARAKERGVKLPMGRPVGVEQAPRSPHRERARYLRSKGLTLSAIAAELGISRQAVSKLLSDG